MEANTKAMVDNTISRVATGASEAMSTARRFLVGVGGGLLTPLPVSALLRLFRKDGSEQEPDPIVYQAPPRVNVLAGLTQANPDEFTPVTYGLRDQPRAVSSVSNRAAAPVVVNVSAIDSRSFLEHADDIAEALRRAMLNSHALTDVIRDF